MVSDRCEHRPSAGWSLRPSDVELERLYDCARAFCLRRSNEGLGIPYIEAIARGRPVVAAPGFRSDFVLDGTPCGLTAGESGLGSTPHAVLKDVSLRDRLMQERRRRAAAFSWDRFVEVHEGAHRDAISAWHSEYTRT
jgi:glycosyltransferase involved in cell wall biosynthesis